MSEHQNHREPGEFGDGATVTTSDDKSVVTGEVLDCPFCGSSAGVFGSGPYRAVCSQCSASLGPVYTMEKSEAIAAWNRRAPAHAPSDGRAVKVGDTVRVLRARNVYGSDVYAFSSKPFVVGETFVVGRVDDEKMGYPCPIAFPEGDETDFWRTDDLELVSAPALDGKPHFDRTCATEGCGNVATEYFERGGVGSYHCEDCAAKINALYLRSSVTTASQGVGVKDLEWFGLESAPKDGTRILLRKVCFAWSSDVCQHVAVGFTAVEGSWTFGMKGSLIGWREWCGNDHTHSTSRLVPTHWCHLPAAPPKGDDQ